MSARKAVSITLNELLENAMNTRSMVVSLALAYLVIAFLEVLK